MFSDFLYSVTDVSKILCKNEKKKTMSELYSVELELTNFSHWQKIYALFLDLLWCLDTGHKILSRE